MESHESSEYGDAASAHHSAEVSRQASAYSSVWSEQDAAEHGANAIGAPHSTSTPPAPLHQQQPLSSTSAAPEALPSSSTSETGGTVDLDTLDEAGPADDKDGAAAAEGPSLPAEQHTADAAAAVDEAAERSRLAAASPDDGDAPEAAPLLPQHAPGETPQQPVSPASRQQPLPVAKHPHLTLLRQREEAKHVRNASSISFGSLASDSQLETLGAASEDGEAGSGGSTGEEEEGFTEDVDSLAAATVGASSDAAASSSGADAGSEGEIASALGHAGVPTGAVDSHLQQQQQQWEDEAAPQLEPAICHSASSGERPGAAESEPAAAAVAAVAAVAAASPPASRLELQRISSSSSTPEQDEDSAWGCWSRRRRHFFVVTSAGKPVYSRHGDEAALAGFLAVIQAVVSVVGDQGDGVRHVTSGPLNVVFMVRGHLYLVAASSRSEPVAALRWQLHMLHQHLLLLVTGGIERALQRNPGYDVRQLLAGSQCSLTALLSSVGDSPFWMMGVLEPAPLGQAERRAAAVALSEAVQAGDAMYGVISAGRQVVALDTGRGHHPLSVLDTQLLLNFLASNDALRVGETFVPVCLPGFNSGAFCHAYVACLDARLGVFLALVSGRGDAFHQLAGRRAHVEQALQRAGTLEKLAAARAAPGGGRLAIDALPQQAGGGAPGAASLWHFAAGLPGRRQGVQAAHAAHMFPDRKSVKELSRAYVRAYCALHAQQLQGSASSGASGGSGTTSSSSGGSGAAAVAAPRPARLFWVSSPRWCLLALSDREMELYCCFDPLVPQEGAVRAAEALRRWLAERPRLEALLLPAGG